MPPAQPPSADDAETLVRQRWYGLDRNDAQTILDAAARLTEEELLDRPHVLTGAVIASDLLRAGSSEKGGDRSALLERYSIVAASAANRNDPRWLMIRMIAARWKGDLDQALALSERLSQREGSAGVHAALLDDSDEVSRPGQIALQRGLTAALAGDASTAMGLFAEAHRSSGPRRSVTSPERMRPPTPRCSPPSRATISLRGSGSIGSATRSRSPRGAATW